MPDSYLQPIGAPYPLSFSGIRAFSSHSLNGSTIKVAWSFAWMGPAPSSALTHLGFRYALRVGTPPTYKISLQGLSAAGEPNGTLKGGGNPTFTPPANSSWDGTFQWVSLAGNTYTPSRGEGLAVIVEYSSGTITSANYGTFGSFLSGAGRTGFPCCLTYNGSVWTKQTSGPPLFGLKNGSRTWGFPLQNCVSTNINTTTQHALAFMLDARLLAGFKVAGIRFVGQLCGGAAAKSVKAVLYQGTSAVGHDVTFDCDWGAGAGLGDCAYTVPFDEATMSMLRPGVQYYIAFEPQEADTNFHINVNEFASSQDAAAYPGGAQFKFASRASGGGTAWTLDSTKRAVAELITEETINHQPKTVQRVV